MKLWKPHTLNGTCPGGWFLGGYTLGLERTVIRIGGEPYLGRWILYIGGRTLRLHKFYKGDDDRAPHDHPWPFWTFPLCSGYDEVVARGSVLMHERVKGWRWNFRPSNYRHIVLDPDAPFYTIVVTGKKNHSWGFWPGSETFVPWRDWTAQRNDHKRVPLP